MNGYIVRCVSLPQLKDGQLDVNTVMNLAKPLLDNIEQQGREVDEGSLRSDIANCTDTSE
jgi:hypothetical protein